MFDNTPRNNKPVLMADVMADFLVAYAATQSPARQAQAQKVAEAMRAQGRKIDLLLSTQHLTRQ